LQSVEIRLGTRGSPLALVQAEATRSALAAALELPAETIAIRPIRTAGDRISDRPLTDVGGKGLFTREIDEALLTGAIDAGVHSAKDLPTRLPEGIALVACLPRADVRDVFISDKAATLEALPDGAVIGSSSLRRRAMALRLRPDLKVADLRGNVGTRLARIAEGRADATILAAAGLARLGLSDKATSVLPVETWLPAPGQGAVAITVRADDARMHALFASIDHALTRTALLAERAYLAVLDGSCRTPIGGLATIAGDQVTLSGLIVKPDGSVAHDASATGAVADSVKIGEAVGAELAGRGGRDFFRV
jgi:hydroxymethylbilane synthase